MQPFERFKKHNTVDNLWIYLLSLGSEDAVVVWDAPKLIFEKFGFLPGHVVVSRVIGKLKSQGYATKEKFQGQTAYKTTDKGKAELEKMKGFCQDLLARVK